MQLVKQYRYDIISKKLSGKQVHFKSDCAFFSNFDVKGKVMNTYLRENEIMFNFKTTSGKQLTIGSNMRNLQFELI